MDSPINLPRKAPSGKSPLHKVLTPYTNRRKSGTSGCFAPFKSPKPNSGDSTVSKRCKIVIAKQVITLKHKKDKIDEELAKLGELYQEEELDVHIEKLHEYNDIKDIGQMLLGRLAEVEQTTTKVLYERYGLGLDD
eukprot:Seg1374.5 transcript_id=Seg1374.5/GoldUCD/mRNA.D3Y31 product="DNA repair protein SWI5" protein_id=Seg1374.5/GoldUCD/D3Y31